jgi:hypothetical protein
VPARRTAGGTDMANDWESAKDKALKLLGDKGKLPDDKFVYKVNDELMKSSDDFHKKRDDFEDVLSDCQAMLLKYSNAIDQLEAKIEGDDLGLDKKNKDDAKKIAAAKKVLTSCLKDIESKMDAGIKGLKEAGRHLILLAKYKIDSGVK